MARKATPDGLLPLEKCVVQPYFSNSIQLAGVIDWVLDQTGPADVMISTFSTSEEFLRRMARLRASGKVGRCSLFCDLRAARKTASLYHFIKGVFDTIALCQNHSKVVLIYNDSFHIAIVTSQNQTRGDRFEAGIITSDTHTFYNLRLGFDRLVENSMPLDVLFQ
ncbi:MAG: hypothetical protein NC212_08995 [Staphylococcus sp.]|nr:hypothetical protein [Staphylococcus sp.]